MNNNKMIRLPHLRQAQVRNDARRGFTLFELLVSISIIAILVALATTSYSAAQKKARDARRMQDMELVRKAAEQYYMLNNSSYSTVCTSGTIWKVGTQTVLESFPIDPKSPTTNYAISSCVAGGYCICATTENKVGNSLDNNCTFSGVGGTGPSYCVKNQQ